MDQMDRDARGCEVMGKGTDQTSCSLLSRRHFFMGGALALTSAVAFAKQPQVHMPRISSDLFEQWVPAEVMDWRTVKASDVVLPPPDELSDRLYDNLVTRTYRGRGDEHVMMLLAYNNRQNGVLQVHRPEVCYPVGGFELSKTQAIEVGDPENAIPANFFTATGPGRIEQVLYFTRLGNAYPRSWAEQRMAVIRENLAGRIPDGMLLRVSVLNPDAAASLGALQSFVRGFVNAVPSGLRSLLVV